MCIIGRIKTTVDTQEKRWSAMSVLIITLIIVTPLCGFLFKCGCDWPWSGLDAKCNFYKSNAAHQCPWCASLLTGLLSTGLAIITGMLTSTATLPLTIKQSASEIAARTLIGILVFMLVAILTGELAALWQDYPLGVVRFLH